MAELPRGTVTFLFTDIEGSTALWERDRQAMAAAVQRHLALLDTAIQAHGGVHYKTVGDAVQAAFPTAPDGVAAALDGLRAVLAEDWGEIGPLSVRIAVHVGEAVPDDRGDYLAAPLNRLSRLLSSGFGGQILLSQTVQQLTRGALPDGVELRDLGEHRLRDLLEPERVFQVLHPALPERFPPLKSLDSHPNNLPLQPSPFLGREYEVGQVVDLLLQSEVRFLTLTGPGGTGKTRLALQAAADVLEEFPDGVFFVPLAPLTDRDLVLGTIATTMGLREGSGQPLGVRLREYLATKQLLLVLDNFEHLADAAPAVGELLETSPSLKVLATSRMPLRLRAEREYAVPPLSLPRRNRPHTLEQLSQYESVRLFIERARAVKADFAVDNESAPAVAEICWRLDGLPLAIELAAARVRMLPPQAMLTRLEHRLPFLTGGARDAPERQRTLRNTIAWSYDLLEPEAQQVFRQLAVFAGGMTLEAAEAVAKPNGHLDIFGTLERLVEQSLLRPEGGPAHAPRFSMLETIREFGLEQLAQSGEEIAIRDAHARFFRVLGADGHRDFALRRSAWLTQLVAEAANVRAALAWVDQRDDAETGLALAAALAYLAMHRGGFDEAGRWLSRFLTDADAASPLQAAALFCAAAMARLLGHITEAIATAKASEEVARAAGREFDVGCAQLIQGLAWIDAGEWDEASSCLNHAVTTGEHLMGAGDVAAPHLVTFGQNGLGVVASILGDGDAAAHYFEAALLAAKAEALDRTHSGLVLANLAEVERERGRAGRAAALLAEALPLLWQGNDLRLVAGGLEAAAWCAHATGEHLRAVRFLAASESVMKRLGVANEPLQPTDRERLVTALQTTLGVEAFAHAWEDGQSVPLAEAVDAAIALVDERARASDESDLPHAPGEPT